jgi:flagellar basal body-associated protein FliL
MGKVIAAILIVILLLVGFFIFIPNVFGDLAFLSKEQIHEIEEASPQTQETNPEVEIIWQPKA